MKILILILILIECIWIFLRPNVYEVREKTADNPKNFNSKSWSINYVGAYFPLQARIINSIRNNAPVFKNVSVKKL